MQLRVMLEQCMRRMCVYDASESGKYHRIGSIAREMSVCGADQCLTKPPPYRHRRHHRRRRRSLPLSSHPQPNQRLKVYRSDRVHSPP